MLRRALNAVLLLAGAAPLGWAVVAVPLGARRSFALGLLLLAGVLLNLIGLLRRRLALRTWLRILAVGVAAAILIGVLAIRWSAHQTLGTVSATNPLARAYLYDAICGSTWLAAALVYVMVSVAVLPRCPGPAAPRPAHDVADNSEDG